MTRRARPGHCPACNAVASPGADNPWRPFCSQRCKLADLGQWFAGRYAIPVDDNGGAEPPQDPQPRQ